MVPCLSVRLSGVRVREGNHRLAPEPCQTPPVKISTDPAGITAETQSAAVGARSASPPRCQALIPEGTHTQRVRGAVVIVVGAEEASKYEESREEEDHVERRGSCERGGQ